MCPLPSPVVFLLLLAPPSLLTAYGEAKAKNYLNDSFQTGGSKDKGNIAQENETFQIVFHSGHRIRDTNFVKFEMAVSHLCLCQLLAIAKKKRRKI